MGRFTMGPLEDVLRADWVDVFHEARSLGFDCVELGVRGDDYGFTELWTDAGLDALARRSEESRVPISSICLHTFWKFSFADPDVSNRMTAKQILLHAYEACRRVGAATILVPVTNPQKLSAEDAAHRWAYEMRACADDAAKAGVRVALEVVGGSHAIKGEEIGALLDDIDSPSVGVYFDVGNQLMLGSDPVADIAFLKDRIYAVHIKDPRKDRTPCLLGGGDVDLAGCLKALIDVDYSGPLVFETPPLDDARDTAARNLKTLRDLIAAAEGTSSAAD